MELSIASGPVQIVDTGSVTTFAGHDLAFTLDWGGTPFVVELRFHVDPSTAEPRVTSEMTANRFVVDVTNFDGDYGRGSSMPVLLGQIGPDLLLMHFRVLKYGRTLDRTVHYTFFRGARSQIEGAAPA